MSSTPVSAAGVKSVSCHHVTENDCLSVMAIALLLGLLLSGCSHKDRSGIAGTYVLDSSGGAWSADVSVVIMTEDGTFRTIYADGKWNCSQGELKIRRLGRTAVGRITQVAGGFTFNGSAGPEKLTHVYTRVFPVTNSAAQMVGKWLALDNCRVFYPGEQPSVSVQNTSVDIVSKTLEIDSIVGASYSELHYTDGRSQFSLIMPDSKHEPEEILAGGSYLCQVLTNANGSIESETIFMRR